MQKIKRLAVYVYYDGYGILRGYAKNTIKELLDFCKCIVVVNGFLRVDDRNEIQRMGARLISRENEGYDFFAYKAGIKSIPISEKSELDELILCNSSVYGPIFPIKELFQDMEGRGHDFWGITQWCNQNPWPDHIQSYFIVFRKRILSSKSFSDYWDGLPAMKSWEEAIEYGETKLTPYFSQRGFSWGTYIKKEIYLNKCLSPSHMYPDALVRQRVPFIKRKCFSDKETYEAQLSLSFGIQAKKTIEEIQRLSKYDVNLIFDDLCSTQVQSQFKSQIGNTFVLPSAYEVSSNSGEEEKHENSALIIFVYFEDLLDECCKYIRSMPVSSGKYVVSCKRDLLEEYKNRLQGKTGNIHFRFQENRGRSEAAYYITCRDVFEKHEYVCCMHDKKMSYTLGILGESMMRHNFDSLLASESYVKNILRLFENNQRIGLLMPATPYFLKVYEGVAASPIGENITACKKILKELSINLKIDKFLNFPVGGMFWVRSEAIAPLFRKQWALEDFPQEPLPINGTVNHALERIIPLVAQEASFMTGYVIPDFCIGNYYEGLEYRLKQLLRNKYSREHYLRRRFPRIAEKCHAIRDYFRKIKRNNI